MAREPPREVGANGEAALTPRRDERSQEAVHRWILTQGYGVEHRAASLFGNHRFQARQGLTYRDVARDKIRDVDVVATAAFLEETGVEVHVVIECKRSPKAWITRTSGLLPTKGSLAWLPIATESVREYLSQDRRPLSELPLTRPFAFDVIETHQEKRETNPAFEAMTQVVAAARGLRASHAQFPNPALFHPVVVLDGSLHRVSFAGATGRWRRGDPSRACLLERCAGT